MTDQQRGTDNLLSKANEKKEEGCLDKLSKIKGKTYYSSFLIFYRLPLSDVSHGIFEYFTYHNPIC